MSMAAGLVDARRAAALSSLIPIARSPVIESIGHWLASIDA
jgi:hypothetical protein